MIDPRSRFSEAAALAHGAAFHAATNGTVKREARCRYRSTPEMPPSTGSGYENSPLPSNRSRYPTAAANRFPSGTPSITVGSWNRLTSAEAEPLRTPLEVNDSKIEKVTLDMSAREASFAATA